MDVRVGLWRKLSTRVDAFELWCWRRLLRVPWTERRSNQFHSEGDQPWVFFGRNDAIAETPVLWPPHGKSWLTGKDPDAGRDWGQEEKGGTEDEMAGWHHRPNGCEFEWTPGVADGQGGQACCDSWGCKESDMTEWLNWTEEKLRGKVGIEDDREQECLMEQYKRRKERNRKEHRKGCWKYSRSVSWLWNTNIWSNYHQIKIYGTCFYFQLLNSNFPSGFIFLDCLSLF